MHYKNIRSSFAIGVNEKNTNLKYYYKYFPVIYMSFSIKSSLFFLHTSHDNTSVVYHVFLLSETASQFARYRDDTVLFAWPSNTEQYVCILSFDWYTILQP